jgi:putative oxidoreductase
VKIKNILLVLIRIFLGALFIFAGTGKILNPSAFAESIDNYRMLPYILVTLMAIILPWVEVIAGLLLVIGRWVKASSFIIIILNAIFIFALSSAIIRGLDIGCGCFTVGGSASKVGIVRLVEDVFYLVLAITLLRSNPAHSQ